MVEYDPQEKELVKTLDRRLLPVLVLLYLAVLFDRSSQLHSRITNPATRAGLEQSIAMDDYHYLWSLGTFSIGALLACVPTSLIFRKFGASVWFVANSLLWGLIAACTAGSKSVGGFIFSRLLLGISQGGFLPCIALFVVYFYVKEESATRLAIVMGAASSFAAFSGLFTHFFAKADAIWGMAGWQWLFLLDGLFGMAIGVITWFYLPNYPETAMFLNQADRVLAVARGKDGQEQDASLVSTGLKKVTKTPLFKFDYYQLVDAAKDVRNWAVSLTTICIMIVLDILILLAPEASATSFNMSHFTLNNATGVSLEIALDSYEDSTIPITFLASVPYIFGLVVSLIVCKYADDRLERSFPAAIALCVSAGGFLFMTIVSPKFEGGGPARFFTGLLPAVVGVMTALPLALTCALDKALDDTFRATTAAIILGPGHAIGILVAGTPSLFPTDGAPGYALACGICTLLMSIGALIMFAMRWYDQKEQDGWGRAPGLRRLMNDQDEAKAWDIELNNVDFLKTNDNFQDEAWE
ncbi:major facilitator superfamily domain-containing protein [Gorgonomyces haynaldii]|nr:major facilitator superfamily domain-containing protein [Gorgonomyces haynaldii]